jgi:hypothetical protein
MVIDSIIWVKQTKETDEKVKNYDIDSANHRC